MTTAVARVAILLPRPASAPGSFALLLAGLAALHGAMLAYDLGHPDRFLNADRAHGRIVVIERFVQAWQDGTGLGPFLAGHGIVGDWLPQAILYLAGGPLLVIAVQVLLALASSAWVREIGLRLGLPQSKASAAALLYALLPHTLVLPHQLASEAVFVPLVVLSFALALRGAATPRHASAGLAMGFAALVRPVTLAWPLIHALLARRARPAARLSYLLAGLAPLALWIGFVYGESGELSMGRSKHDLGYNLYQRVQRMAPQLPPAERFADRKEPRLGVGEYARFIAAHPGAAAEHAGRDLMALGLKSGIERVLLDYLDLYPDSRGLQDSAAGWRKSLEEGGALAALGEIARETPTLFFAAVGGAALFAVFMALAAIGTYVFVRTGRLLLVVYVFYVFATATAVDAAQSRHRAPAEFALCLLAVTGFWVLQRRREPTRQERMEPTLNGR